MKQLWQENKGSITTFAVISIVAVLMMMFLTINIGNIFAKKNLVEDTADAIGKSLLTSQINKYIDKSVPTSTTPENVVDAILTLYPSIDKRYNIYFGILDSAENFTLLTASNYSNVNIDPTDPNLEDITLSTGENFAVNFQLIHVESPLATLGEALNVSVTLQGKSSYATALETFPEPPGDKKNNCCCTSTTPPGKSWMMGMFCGYGGFKQCLFMMRNPASYCDQFYACQGTLFSNFFNGTAFSSMINLFKCWWVDFVQRLINSIRKVNSVIDNWTGWEAA